MGRPLALAGLPPGVRPFLSEFGGLRLKGPGPGWGYREAEDEEAFLREALRYLETACGSRLSGFCYTQLYDTFQEENGLLDFWRRPKVPPRGSGPSWRVARRGGFSRSREVEGGCSRKRPWEEALERGGDGGPPGPRHPPPRRPLRPGAGPLDAPGPPSPWQGVGRVQGLRAIPGGVRVRFAEAELEAVFLGEDLLRLTWSPGEALPPYALAEEASP